VSGFHSEEATRAADENWARQFQQKSDDVEGLEEVYVTAAELGRDAEGRVRVSRLLTMAGLAASASEADRKIKEGAVRIDGETVKQAHITLNGTPKLTLRVGKRAKIAVIE
jgi:tyrosyl-tRNA synthetase